MPLQHLTGRAHFRRLTLAVGPGVFVPRPETEVTAGLAIDAASAAGPDAAGASTCARGRGPSRSPSRTSCPGPGCWPSSCPTWPTAGRWRTATGSGSTSSCGCGDATTAFDDLEGEVDVVVSNPPYIPVGAVPVDPEVRDHDPEVALYGGSADGLAVPLAVAARAAVLLRAGGVLVMEHADSQGVTLPRALRATGEWVEVVDHTDLANRPRTTVAVRRSGSPT